MVRRSVVCKKRPRSGGAFGLCSSPKLTSAVRTLRSCHLGDGDPASAAWMLGHWASHLTGWRGLLDTDRCGARPPSRPLQNHAACATARRVPPVRLSWRGSVTDTPSTFAAIKSSTAPSGHETSKCWRSSDRARVQQIMLGFKADLQSLSALLGVATAGLRLSAGSIGAVLRTNSPTARVLSGRGMQRDGLSLNHGVGASRCDRAHRVNDCVKLDAGLPLRCVPRPRR